MSEQNSIGSTVDRLSQNRRYNWLGLVVALSLLAICLLFLLPAALSDNLFFAFNNIRLKPIQVTVYYRGQTKIYKPESQEYDSLVDACYETLYNQIGIVELGWPDEQFEQARAAGIAVELLYAEPVKLPGKRFDIADPVRLFFPLDVRNFKREVVFRGSSDDYWGCRST